MTRPIRLEQPVQERPPIRGLFSAVTLRTDQKSWDGDVVPAGASGAVVEILQDGEAYVVDVVEPFDAIVTVRAPELEATDER